MDQPIKESSPQEHATREQIDTEFDVQGRVFSERSLHRLRLLVLVLALFAIFYRMTATIVEQGDSAIVVRLGNPIRVLDSAGLYFTLPWPIEEVVRIDQRRRTFETQHTEMLTKDKKNVVLVSFVIWSVADPLKFYQSIGSIKDADGKLNGLVTNAKIGVLGKYDLSALASTEVDRLQTKNIETELLTQTQDLARKQYGIQIQHIGFSRLSLPKENIKAVFQQMRAERKKYAVEFRAKGDEEASRIRAITDSEVAALEAQMTEEVAKIQGEAEAQAAKIYADAHSQDPNLYRFIRSLDTLEDVIGPKSTLILRTDAPPFDVLVTE